MNDLYGSNAGAISQGNARTQQVRDLNDKIRQHNDDVADKIQGLRDQEKSNSTMLDIERAGKEMWQGANLPNKVKGYQDWRAKRQASNPSSNTTKNLGADAEAGDPMRQAMSESQLTTEARQPPRAEGSPSGAGAEEEVAEVSEGAGSKLAKGMPGIADMAEDGLTKLGKYAGVAGGLAQGTMDIMSDFKGGTFHLAGDNTEHKIGGVLNLAGSIADVGGAIFPPLALVGGALDLASGAVNEIGDLVSEDKQSDELKQKQASETIAPVAQSTQQTIATGRVQ
tara:strand:+ start:250 stop:1095 length:846 start_codon:yes stop_codon:yes gene_type:complete